MFKVTNISKQVIGLILDNKGVSIQKNLFAGQSIEVSELTEQINRLSDPAKRFLSIKLLEDNTKNTVVDSKSTTSTNG